MWQVSVIGEVGRIQGFGWEARGKEITGKT